MLPVSHQLVYGVSFLFSIINFRFALPTDLPKELSLKVIRLVCLRLTLHKMSKKAVASLLILLGATGLCLGTPDSAGNHTTLKSPSGNIFQGTVIIFETQGEKMDIREGILSEKIHVEACTKFMTCS